MVQVFSPTGVSKVTEIGEKLVTVTVVLAALKKSPTSMELLKGPGASG
jgi:hypothetical protein